MKFNKSTQKGATLVEYGMLLAMISTSSVMVVSTVGPKVSAAFSNVNTMLSYQGPQGNTGSSGSNDNTNSSASNNNNNQQNGHGYAYGLGNGNGNAYAYGHNK